MSAQGTSQPVSWFQRDVLLFANSIGCTVDELHFLYELDPKFSVFPTYPIILPFKGTSPEVIDFYAAQSSSSRSNVGQGAPALDSRRVVDGERVITFLKPLPASSAGRSFEMRSKVLGVYDKGKPGTVVETEQVLVEKTAAGEEVVFTRAVGSAFFVGQGGWGGPKGPKTVNYPPPQGREPDAEYTHRTTAESAHLYRLNGDYNPLHATPAPGAAMGFGGAILHGLYSWNTTCRALLQLLGGSDPANIKEFGARFASPVRPGDVLVTRMWRGAKEGGGGGVDGDGFEEVRFETLVKGGKVCLSNGRARVRVVGAAGAAGQERAKL